MILYICSVSSFGITLSIRRFAVFLAGYRLLSYQKRYQS
ncbi:hypothetical protein EWT61_04905 [Vibrio alginolyticus]|nr:hypothetical protein EWT61_04905 [Vibrio alginolyticus]